jgi:glycosyltransferase involved in cell wall biosynthesis
MKSSYPKISIVTPSFNQGEFIEQTILSVLNQNYPNLEYIIIDGGSTDNTIQIIKKYEAKLSFWISEKDKGQTDAINKGFQKSTGDIFNWLNSDDYLEPLILFKIAEIFQKNPLMEVLCGREWLFENEKPENRVLSNGTIISRKVEDTVRIGIIDQPCTYFKKAVIEKYFPLNVDLKYVMDKELWWKYLLENGQDNVLHTNLIISNFRLHSLSKSILEGETKFKLEEKTLRKSLFMFLKFENAMIDYLNVSENLEITWQIKNTKRSLLKKSYLINFLMDEYVEKGINKMKKLNAIYLKNFIIPKIINIKILIFLNVPYFLRRKIWKIN